MWLIGVLVLMSLTAGVAALASRRRRSAFFSAHWDLANLAGSYAGIVGPLAGFSVAAAVFLANLTRAAQTPSFADVMAMFLIAFIMLVGTAIMFATFRSAIVGPQSSEDSQVAHRVMYVLSNVGFYLGLTMSWLGLRPLLVSIDLMSLANVFTWLLFFTILAGGARLGAWLYSLLGVRPLASLTVSIVSVTAAAIYRLALVRRFPSLWPSVEPTLTFAILVFAVGALAFGVETAMIAFHGEKRMHVMLQRTGSIVLPSYVAVAVTAVALLWLSVATT